MSILPMAIVFRAPTVDRPSLDGVRARSPGAQPEVKPCSTILAEHCSSPLVLQP